MRKLNTLLTILIMVMFGIHSISSALYLAGCLDYVPFYQITGRRLFIVICLHFLISLTLYVKENNKKRHTKVDVTLTLETNLQMFSGIGLVVLMVIHVLLYSCYSAEQLPNSEIIIFVHWIVDVLFISAIMIHLLISIPRLCISMGVVSSEGNYEKIKKVSKIIITLLWIGYIFAEIIFY